MKHREHDLVTRLREGRTNGTDLRWQSDAIHKEAAAEIERLRANGTRQQAEIELLKVRLENAEDDAVRLHKLTTDRWQALLELRCRDDRNESLPPAYRKIIDDALADEQSDKTT